MYGQVLSSSCNRNKGHKIRDESTHSEHNNIQNHNLDVVRALEVPLALCRRLLALDADQSNMAKGALPSTAGRRARATGSCLHGAATSLPGHGFKVGRRHRTEP